VQFTFLFRGSASDKFQWRRLARDHIMDIIHCDKGEAAGITLDGRML
jgi:hypothetical protein